MRDSSGSRYLNLGVENAVKTEEIFLKKEKL